MKAAFYAAPDYRIDATLAAALARGFAAIGVSYETISTADWPGCPVADVAIVAGVQGCSKAIFDAYLAVGRHAAIIDKGYTRGRLGPDRAKYWRITVDAFQPLAYLFNVPRPGDRWDATGVAIAQLAQPGRTVLFAGSSQNYCDWYGLGDATAYAADVLAELRQTTVRPIVYRPSPSHRGRQPISGYRYSGDDVGFADELADAACVVTHGSNACFEAWLAGVAAVSLGDGVTQLRGMTAAGDVDSAFWPGYDAVLLLSHQLAYCQWTLAELASELAAKEIVRLVEEAGAWRI